jgi:hypoxanthine phosphoribosyltransferase
MVVNGLPAVEVLISRSELAERVNELGRQIPPLYADAAEPPVLTGVLKGSTMFLADLVRAMGIDVNIDFMAISSYSPSGEHSGLVRIVKDLDISIEGRDVLIVEDIVDTGLTLNYLRKTLTARGPKSLRAVTLLDKAVRRIVPVELEFSGFEVDDVFVVGYGLDFQGLYRNVQGLLAVRDLPRLANDPTLLVPSLWPSPRHG